nr:Type 1 glutamine amidotransferase-like domain-containing protein [Heyndrickxia oleronia]
MLKAKKDFLQMGFTQVGFIDIEYDNLQLLEQCQIIYINGGNPFYLLYQMKKSRTDIILRDFVCRRNMIIGVSAGAVVLGPNIEIVPEMNSIKLRDFKALGLTNKIIFPHYDREDLFLNSEGKSIEDRLQEYESLHNCMITRLKNNQFLISEYLIE